jgi:hypothetical protein
MRAERRGALLPVDPADQAALLDLKGRLGITAAGTRPVC